MYPEISLSLAAFSPSYCHSSSRGQRGGMEACGAVLMEGDHSLSQCGSNPVGPLTDTQEAHGLSHTARVSPL